MRYLFPALQTRYLSVFDLARIGRRLFEDVDSVPANHAGNYTVVTGEMVDGSGTFSSDVETWELRFGLIGKSVKPDDARLWLTAMNGTFKDNVLVSHSAAFRSVAIWEVGQEAPEIEGHTFVAGWSCSIMIELSVMSPLTRA
jgi:hypothetical protein